MSVSNVCYNTFGMDSEGFGRWLLSPMPLRKVMRAKNVAYGLLMSVIYLVGAVAVLIMGRVPWRRLPQVVLRARCADPYAVRTSERARYQP